MKGKLEILINKAIYMSIGIALPGITFLRQNYPGTEAFTTISILSIGITSIYVL